MAGSGGDEQPSARPRRVLGIETEYGISAVGGPAVEDLHPMQLSNHLVKAYGALAPGQPAGWDYETESPLRDSRGYEVARADAHPDQLTDADLGMANLILTNGARLYVDHAHPEYSGPEVTSALDAVRYDKAGDAIMAAAAVRASASLGRSVRLYKNNTDGKGASYGTHENYLLDRGTPFDRIVTQFTGFLVSRQVITGAGRVGIGQASQSPGFQISQRADFFEAEVGLETTLNRPIINTRDEPHADASRHRRLHVITGDANLSEISTYLKVGTASWALRVIEAGELPPDLRFENPVGAMRAISHDLTCRRAFPLLDGRMLTAPDVQEIYLDHCRANFERTAGELTEGARIEAKDLFVRWQDCLDGLRRDPHELADSLDWVAKLALMESYRARDGLGWDAPKLALIDLQYADVDPRRSLYAALVAKGKLRRLVSDEDVER
ncbi:MAG: depupylase/deamidase Dop, partial [Actinomycetes bacterium]